MIQCDWYYDKNKYNFFFSLVNGDTFFVTNLNTLVLKTNLYNRHLTSILKILYCRDITIIYLLQSLSGFSHF